MPTSRSAPITMARWPSGETSTLGRCEPELTLLEHLAVDEIDHGEVTLFGVPRNSRPPPGTAVRSSRHRDQSLVEIDWRANRVQGLGVEHEDRGHALGDLRFDVLTHGRHDEMFAVGGVVEIEDSRPLVRDLPFRHDAGRPCVPDLNQPLGGRRRQLPTCRGARRGRWQLLRSILSPSRPVSRSRNCSVTAKARRGFGEVRDDRAGWICHGLVGDEVGLWFDSDA